MAVNPDEDTEFNDALRQHGILPPKPAPQRTPSPPASPSFSSKLDSLTLAELRDLGEEAEDHPDKYDSDTERLINDFQRKRKEQIIGAARKARFGRVYPISREDYTREVTDASKVHEDAEKEDGTGVVCFLYKDSHVASERVFEYIRSLAPKYPQSKFVSIVGDKCIPNYPDRNLPTLILYRNGQMVENLVAWGANEKEPGTIHHLETVLLGTRIISMANFPNLDQAFSAYRDQGKDKDRSDESDDDGSDEDDRDATRGARNARLKKNIRQKAESDDGSDFDL